MNFQQLTSIIIVLCTTIHTGISRDLRNSIESDLEICKNIIGQEGVCVPPGSCRKLSWRFRNIIMSCNYKCQKDFVCCKKSNVIPKMKLPVPGEGCGFMVSDKISRYGTRAAIGDHPWIALFLTENLEIKCSGVLINERYVLTSADCIIRNPVTIVRLGEYNTNTMNDCYRYGVTKECSDQPQEISIADNIEDVKIHKKANIALVKLARPAVKSIFVRPICLPIQNEDTRNDEGKEFTIAGWKNGEFVEKQTTDIQGVSSSECNGTSEIICTRGEDVIDDGGPLMAVHNDGKGNNYYYAAGILESKSIESEEKNVTIEFTRISNYVTWIQDNLFE